MKKQKHWSDYLWVASVLYLLLGMVHILFAYLGLICFALPLAIAAIKGNKAYCNTYCGRGQLFGILGERLKLSRNKPIPPWMRSKWFRYGFLTFFMTMFGLMLFSTYKVFAGAKSLSQALTLLWVFNVPWGFADVSGVPAAAAQFAYGFYSVMLTSTILGLITMLLYKPRSWCVYCPMGTMTQGICRLKHGNAPAECTVSSSK